MSDSEEPWSSRLVCRQIRRLRRWYRRRKGRSCWYPKKSTPPMLLLLLPIERRWLSVMKASWCWFFDQPLFILDVQWSFGCVRSDFMRCIANVVLLVVIRQKLAKQGQSVSRILYVKRIQRSRRVLSRIWQDPLCQGFKKLWRVLQSDACRQKLPIPTFKRKT